MTNLKRVIVHETQTGPTGLMETVHVYTGPTGPTGRFETWQSAEGGPTGFFKHVINGGATAGRKNVIINGYTPPTTPFDYQTVLGSNLIEAWDANRGDTILETSDQTYANVVSSWLGIVTGANLAQSTPLLKPTYDPVGLAGGPCITFDGVQQYLNCTDSGLMALLPTGATPCEIWVLCSQDIAAADSTTRHVVGYAASSVINGRSLARLPVSAVNRARIYTGTGAAASVATDTHVDFSGVHVLRGVWGATQSTVDVDGSGAVAVSVVPVTSTPTLFRVGAIPALAASNWWSGKVAAVILTKPLTTDQAAALHAYLG